MDKNTVGLNGAVFEIKKPSIGDVVNGFTVIDVNKPTPGDSNKLPSAVVLKDAYGNIHVHFYGTPDGYWGENCAAAGGKPSSVQAESLKYFNDTIERLQKDGMLTGKVYVSGHSQGGNNAQYVTIRSPYADYIETCVSLNGPGFSNQFETDSINLLGGQKAYDDRRNKIFGIYTENDFASAYGQKDIIDPKHISFVKQSTHEQAGAGASDNPLWWFHAAEYMVHQDKDGNWVWNDRAKSSALRELILKLSAEIYATHSDEESRRLLYIILDGIAEGATGGDYLGNLSPEDFEYLLQHLTPALLKVLQENPELLKTALETFGLDQRLIDAAGGLVNLLNGSPETLQAIFGAISYKDGKIIVDWSKLPEVVGAVIKDIRSALNDWWNNAKANINKIGKDFMGAMFGKDILIDEEAFIKASDDLAALSERLQKLHGDVDAMLKTLEKGWDTPAGKKFKNSCDAILIQPLKDQKAVLDHVAAVLKTSKIQYQSVFDAYRNLNNSITSYAG